MMYKTAEGQNISLQLLRESDVNWSYFSPSANFDKDGLKQVTINSEIMSYLKII